MEIRFLDILYADPSSKYGDYEILTRIEKVTSISQLV